MLRRYKKPAYRRLPVFPGMILALLVLTFLQPACSKKAGPSTIASAPVRVVLLPFNVPPGDKDLQWASLAAPVLMAKKGEQAEGLELVSLWETMPFARDNAGNTRTFTPDSAANVASWMSAKWAVLGEFAPSKNGVSMTVDFIPVRGNQVAFRYLKRGKIESIGAGFEEAYTQFLRYLVATPLKRRVYNPELSLPSMKALAEAVDREYGWFVEAAPGSAKETIQELMKSDARLARFLFSPSVYPELAEKPAQ